MPLTTRTKRKLSKFGGSNERRESVVASTRGIPEGTDSSGPAKSQMQPGYVGKSTTRKSSNNNNIKIKNDEKGNANNNTINSQNNNGTGVTVSKPSVPHLAVKIGNPKGMSHDRPSDTSQRSTARTAAATRLNAKAARARRHSAIQRMSAAGEVVPPTGSTLSARKMNSTSGQSTSNASLTSTSQMSRNSNGNLNVKSSSTSVASSIDETTNDMSNSGVSTGKYSNNDSNINNNNANGSNYGGSGDNDVGSASDFFSKISFPGLGIGSNDFDNSNDNNNNNNDKDLLGGENDSFFTAEERRRSIALHNREDNEIRDEKASAPQRILSSAQPGVDMENVAGVVDTFDENNNSSSNNNSNGVFFNDYPGYTGGMVDATTMVDSTLLSIPTMRRLIDNARSALSTLGSRANALASEVLKSGKSNYDEMLESLQLRIEERLARYESELANRLTKRRAEFKSQLEAEIFERRADLREERDTLVEDFIETTSAQLEEKLEALIAKVARLEQKQTVDLSVIAHLEANRTRLRERLREIGGSLPGIDGQDGTSESEDSSGEEEEEDDDDEIESNSEKEYRNGIAPLKLSVAGKARFETGKEWTSDDDEDAIAALSDGVSHPSSGSLLQGMPSRESPEVVPGAVHSARRYGPPVSGGPQHNNNNADNKTSSNSNNYNSGMFDENDPRTKMVVIDYAPPDPVLELPFSANEDVARIVESTKRRDAVDKLQLRHTLSLYELELLYHDRMVQRFDKTVNAVHRARQEFEINQLKADQMSRVRELWRGREHVILRRLEWMLNERASNNERLVECLKLEISKGRRHGHRGGHSSANQDGQHRHHRRHRHRDGYHHRSHLLKSRRRKLRQQRKGSGGGNHGSRRGKGKSDGKAYWNESDDEDYSYSSDYDDSEDSGENFEDALGRRRRARMARSFAAKPQDAVLEKRVRSGLEKLAEKLEKQRLQALTNKGTTSQSPRQPALRRGIIRSQQAGGTRYAAATSSNTGGAPSSPKVARTKEQIAMVKGKIVGIGNREVETVAAVNSSKRSAVAVLAAATGGAGSAGQPGAKNSGGNFNDSDQEEGEERTDYSAIWREEREPGTVAPAFTEFSGTLIAATGNAAAGAHHDDAALVDGPGDPGGATGSPRPPAAWLRKPNQSPAVRPSPRRLAMYRREKLPFGVSFGEKAAAEGRKGFTNHTLIRAVHEERTAEERAEKEKARDEPFAVANLAISRSNEEEQHTHLMGMAKQFLKAEERTDKETGDVIVDILLTFSKLKDIMYY